MYHDRSGTGTMRTQYATGTVSAAVCPMPMVVLHCACVRACVRACWRLRWWRRRRWWWLWEGGLTSHCASLVCVGASALVDSQTLGLVWAAQSRAGIGMTGNTKINQVGCMGVEWGGGQRARAARVPLSGVLTPTDD